MLYIHLNALWVLQYKFIPHTLSAGDLPGKVTTHSYNDKTGRPAYVDRLLPSCSLILSSSSVRSYIISMVRKPKMSTVVGGLAVGNDVKAGQLAEALALAIGERGLTEVGPGHVFLPGHDRGALVGITEALEELIYSSSSHHQQPS